MHDIKNLVLRFKYGKEVCIDKGCNIYCSDEEEKTFFEGNLALFFAENFQYKDSPYFLMYYKEHLENMGAEILEFHLIH